MYLILFFIIMVPTLFFGQFELEERAFENERKKRQKKERTTEPLAPEKPRQPFRKNISDAAVDRRTSSDKSPYAPRKHYYSARSGGYNPDPVYPYAESGTTNYLRSRSRELWRKWSDTLIYLKLPGERKPGSLSRNLDAIYVRNFTAHPKSLLSRIPPQKGSSVRAIRAVHKTSLTDPHLHYMIERSVAWFACSCVECRTALLDRTVNIKCDIFAASRIDITAPCVVRGNLNSKFVRLRDAGNVLGDVTASTVTTSGETLVNGTITASKMIAQGSLSVRDIKAGDATFLLSAAPCHAENIEAERTLRISLFSDVSSARLTAKNVQADNVQVDGLVADAVRGDDVSIRKNCVIDRVYYHSRLYIEPGARVRQVIHVSEDGSAHIIEPRGTAYYGGWWGLWIGDTPTNWDGNPAGTRYVPAGNPYVPNAADAATIADTAEAGASGTVDEQLENERKGNVPSV